MFICLRFLHSPLINQELVNKLIWKKMVSHHCYIYFCATVVLCINYNMSPMNIAGRHVCRKAKIVIVTHESRTPGQTYSPSSAKIGETGVTGAADSPIVIQRLHLEMQV